MRSPRLSGWVRLPITPPVYRQRSCPSLANEHGTKSLALKAWCGLFFAVLLIRHFMQLAQIAFYAGKLIEAAACLLGQLQLFYGREQIALPGIAVGQGLMLFQILAQFCKAARL